MVNPRADGFDSVELARTQAEETKREIEARQNSEWKPVRKTRFPDVNQSEDLLNRIYAATKMRGNPMTIDSLASEWSYEDLVTAVDKSAEIFKIHPMGYDRFIASMVFLLEQACTA